MLPSISFPSWKTYAKSISEPTVDWGVEKKSIKGCRTIFKGTPELFKVNRWQWNINLLLIRAEKSSGTS